MKAYLRQARDLLAPGFALTRDERRILCLVLALALLGLAARAWHATHRPPPPDPEPPAVPAEHRG